MIDKYFVTKPVVVIVYKRINSLATFLRALNKTKITNLYVIADGPKDESERKACDDVIKYIKENHQAAHIYFNIADHNMGLRDRIITGLNWVFEREDRAIILEDDCIPDQSFFPFAEELLEKYAHDERVLSIGGFTSLKGVADTSYVFSRYIESWGWATWKRAWSKFDREMADWPKLRKTSWLDDYLGNFLVAKYWHLIFDDTIRFLPNSWAYRWMYTAFKHRGLTIFPTHNLVQNIGFDHHATHTKKQIKLPPVVPMQFPLIHPSKVEVNETHDRLYNRKLLSNPIGVLGLLKAHLLMTLGFKS